MRTVAVMGAGLAVVVSACVSAPNAGALGEGFDLHPAITSVDSGRPPQSAWIDLDRQNYVAMLLVTPGRGVTLLYPRDSVVENRFAAGAHQLTFQLTNSRAQVDSLNRLRRRTSSREDTLRSAAEQRAASRMPVAPDYDSFLLLIASPEQLSYVRIHDKLAGVSIPIDDMEALNAVSKAVKSTLAIEPREWGAFYHLVDLASPH